MLIKGNVGFVDRFFTGLGIDIDDGAVEWARQNRAAAIDAAVAEILAEFP